MPVGTAIRKHGPGRKHQAPPLRRVPTDCWGERWKTRCTELASKPSFCVIVIGFCLETSPRYTRAGRKLSPLRRRPQATHQRVAATNAYRSKQALIPYLFHGPSASWGLDRFGQLWKATRGCCALRKCRETESDCDRVSTLGCGFIRNQGCPQRVHRALGTTLHPALLLRPLGSGFRATIGRSVRAHIGRSPERGGAALRLARRIGVGPGGDHISDGADLVRRLAGGMAPRRGMVWGESGGHIGGPSVGTPQQAACSCGGGGCARPLRRPSWAPPPGSSCTRAGASSGSSPLGAARALRTAWTASSPLGGRHRARRRRPAPGASGSPRNESTFLASG